MSPCTVAGGERLWGLRGGGSAPAAQALWAPSQSAARHSYPQSLLLFPCVARARARHRSGGGCDRSAGRRRRGAAAGGLGRSDAPREGTTHGRTQLARAALPALISFCSSLAEDSRPGVSRCAPDRWVVTARRAFAVVVRREASAPKGRRAAPWGVCGVRRCASTHTAGGGRYLRSALAVHVQFADSCAARARARRLHVSNGAGGARKPGGRKRRRSLLQQLDISTANPAATAYRPRSASTVVTRTRTTARLGVRHATPVCGSRQRLRKAWAPRAW